MPVEVPTARFTRQVRAILIVVGLFGLLIAAGLTIGGAYLYRAHSFRRHTLASIVEVSAEPDERARFAQDVQRRLLAGDFDGLDRLARDLRASRETFSTGRLKLTAFYDVLGGRGPTGEQIDLAEATEQAEAWVKERPESVAAHLVLAELWAARAWRAKWDPSPSAPEDENLESCVAKAWGALVDAHSLPEQCPHVAAAEMRIGLMERWPAEKEAAAFRAAVEAEPEYQPYYGLHLLYAEEHYGGKPGDWEKVAEDIAARPQGAARVARAVWQSSARGHSARSNGGWPIVRAGFQDLLARYPDSFEVKSAYCYFAADFKDLAETRRLLGEIGYRMQTNIWRDRQQFLQVHRWATFDPAERERIPMRWLSPRPRD